MQNQISLPPSDYVEWTIAPEKLASLLPLADQWLSWEEYMALELPIVIGKLTPKGIESFAPDPELQMFDTERYTTIDPSNKEQIEDSIRNAARKLVRKIGDGPGGKPNIMAWPKGIRRLHRSGHFDIPWPSKTREEMEYPDFRKAIHAKIKSQSGIVHSLLSFDQINFGNAKTVTLKLDHDILTQSNTRVTHWHWDANQRPTGMWKNLSKVREPVSFFNDVQFPNRLYTLRASVPTEFARHELHLISEETRRRIEEFKQRKTFWSKRALIKHLREARAITQPLPYEIAFSTEFTIHRSAMPKEPTPSNFALLIVHPRHSLN